MDMSRARRDFSRPEKRTQENDTNLEMMGKNCAQCLLILVKKAIQVQSAIKPQTLVPLSQPLEKQKDNMESRREWYIH